MKIISFQPDLVHIRSSIPGTDPAANPVDLPLDAADGWRPPAPRPPILPEGQVTLRGRVGGARRGRGPLRGGLQPLLRLQPRASKLLRGASGPGHRRHGRHLPGLLPLRHRELLLPLLRDSLH